METGNIVWTGSPDDQTAVCGEYVLRVEQMDRYYWWWAVSYQGEEIATEYTQLPEQAKAAAIAAMNEHLKKK